jgi:hypothetical protein
MIVISAGIGTSEFKTSETIIGIEIRNGIEKNRALVKC